MTEIERIEAMVKTAEGALTDCRRHLTAIRNKRTEMSPKEKEDKRWVLKNLKLARERLKNAEDLSKEYKYYDSCCRMVHTTAGELEVALRRTECAIQIVELEKHLFEE